MKQILLAACLLLSPVVMAESSSVRAPYPWEKQGPAVPNFAIQPIRSHPCLLMDSSDSRETFLRHPAIPVQVPQGRPR